MEPQFSMLLYLTIHKALLSALPLRSAPSEFNSERLSQDLGREEDETTRDDDAADWMHGEIFELYTACRELYR